MYYKGQTLELNSCWVFGSRCFSYLLQQMETAMMIQLTLNGLGYADLCQLCHLQKLFPPKNKAFDLTGALLYMCKYFQHWSFLIRFLEL